MADTPFNLLELPGVFEPGVYASVVYDSDPGLAAHRIGFALVRVRTPYPSSRMATQIGNIAQILDGAIDFYNKRGAYVPDRTLPTDKLGVPVPDSPFPHTQLGRSKPKYGAEPQAREWQHGSNGQLQPTRDIDFSDHGTPGIHPKPHQHDLSPNNPDLAPQGGFRRGPAKPL